MSGECSLPAHSRTLPQQFAAVSRHERQLASEEARCSAPFGEAGSLHSGGGRAEPKAPNWEECCVRRQQVRADIQTLVQVVGAPPLTSGSHSKGKKICSSMLANF